MFFLELESLVLKNCFLTISLFILVGIFGSLFGATPEDGSKDISALVISPAVLEPIRLETTCREAYRPYARGVASWYGPGFHGKTMANGRRFDMEAFTVAHKTLRLGTVVCITNRANGQSVEATVTDRGPYIEPRIIDLSKRVADELGLTEQGLGTVDIYLPRINAARSI